MKIITLNKVNYNHLQTVKKTMMQKGIPRIKAVMLNGCIVCLEGSHRVTAAFELGVEINFKFFDYNKKITKHHINTMDVFNMYNPKWLVTFGAVAEKIFTESVVGIPTLGFTSQKSKTSSFYIVVDSFNLSIKSS